MSKGHVRELIERINSTTSGNEEEGRKESKECLKASKEVLEQNERKSEGSKLLLTLQGIEPGDQKKKSEEEVTFECDNDSGSNENGCTQTMSLAESFNSSSSDSYCSYYDFSDESDSEDKVFLEQTDTKKGLQRDKLYMIADELLTTERAYVKRLHLLNQVFPNRTTNMLPAEVIIRIFGNIDGIFQFHNNVLLPELEECMSNWDHEQKIGNLMNRNAPFLNMYTDYVKTWKYSVNLINTWQKKSIKFYELIQEFKGMPEYGFLSLQDHMLEPIQRVPRYELLLKDYIKELPSDSPDHPDAQAALNHVTTAAKHFGEAMEKIEKFRKLLEIQRSLRGISEDLTSPTRELIHKGPITKISSRSGKKKQRYLFLFNDMLLICIKQLGDTFRLEHRLDIDGMQIKDGENVCIDNTFLVMSRRKTSELWDSETGDDGPTWFDIIEKAIEDFCHKKKAFVNRNEEALESEQETKFPDNVLGKRAPRWINDGAAPMCMRCQAGFSAVKRRHHCRACGYVVCGKCCKKAQIAYMDYNIKRVCGKCYDVLVCPESSVASSPDSDKGFTNEEECINVLPASA